MVYTRMPSGVAHHETNSARSPTASFAAHHFADILCLCPLIVRRSFPTLDSSESSSITLIPTRMKPGQSLDYKLTHQLYIRPPQSCCLLIIGDTFQPLTVGRRLELSTCLKHASCVCLEWYARTSPPFHVCNAQIWSCLMQVNNRHSPFGLFLYSIFWPTNESRAWPHLFSSTQTAQSCILETNTTHMSFTLCHERLWTTPDITVTLSDLIIL